MSALRAPFFWVLLVVVGGVGLLPILTGSDGTREDVFLVLMLVILASSINIIMGYTGYVSFGHIVFFGLGGYVAFYLMLNHQVHFVAAALVGGIVSSLIAFLLGIPVLRLRGAYFALATIGINEVVRSFVTNFDPFGGATGMFFNYQVYDSYGGAKNALWFAYDAILIVALLCTITSLLIKKSKFGLGLLAIREDQDASQVLGIDPSRSKVVVYTISAFFPGLAGAIFFFKNGIIEPGPAFDLLRSIEALVMVMLGGYGTVAGPIVGAAVYEQLRAFLITNPTFSSLHLFVAGFLLLLIVLFVTNGLVGWLRQRTPQLRRYLE
ncbi:MAG: branched-chain amino acid ABC transporter permease [Chloroflexi bacterium]|nr:branched-chain amino acid ABC transporter permease [Chloroflexota bacterium]